MALPRTPIKQNNIFETPYTQNGIFKTPIQQNGIVEARLFIKWTFETPPM